MKIIILLGFLGATLSAPLIPQRLMSASNSNESFNLNNGQLLPLRFQGPLNLRIPPFSGVSQQQQQAQIPGLTQFSLSALDQFARLFPNQIPFPGQASFAQGAQAGQVDPSWLKHRLTQPGPNESRKSVMPYVFSFKMPQEQGQMFQYYPVYMLLLLGTTLKTVPRSPQQTRQQQYEEQAIPGGQQQLAFDPQLGTAPEIAVMSTGEEIPYLQKEVINFRHDGAGVFMPSTSPKPSTTNVFTSAIDRTITAKFPEEKAKTDSLREP
nr:odontogenic ameloblast-associated protein isoform X2 [Chlorocebus sabaeus]